VRAALVRWSLIGLIVFGVLGGALVAGAAIAPRVISDVARTAVARALDGFENMSPEAEQELSELLQRADRLLGDERACTPGSAPGLGESK
jgi:hypothetical protein